MAGLRSAAVSVMLLAGITAWLGASSVGTLPQEDFTPRPRAPLTHSDAARLDALARATLRLAPGDGRFTSVREPDPLSEASHLTCVFAPDEPSGTTPKFRCVLPGGEVIKVKYGRTPEIHAEVAATRLLELLGYPTDTTRIVPWLRCYGCPRYPFVTSHLWQLPLLNRLVQPPDANGYTDFEAVSVEWTFPAPAIKTATTEGWSWWELKYSTLPREELDALRLLAVFLTHWDNKTDNQRLVCLDTDAPTSPPGHGCREPLLMVQDLGATFGPHKANLSGWRHAPVWTDQRRCRVSMRTLPFNGASFPDVDIAESARQRIVEQLSALSKEQIRHLFERARFHHYHSATDDERDLDAWSSAFRDRVAKLAQAGPCPNP